MADTVVLVEGNLSGTQTTPLTMPEFHNGDVHATAVTSPPAFWYRRSFLKFHYPSSPGQNSIQIEHPISCGYATSWYVYVYVNGVSTFTSYPGASADGVPWTLELIADSTNNVVVMADGLVLGIHSVPYTGYDIESVTTITYTASCAGQTGNVPAYVTVTAGDLPPEGFWEQLYNAELRID